MATEDIEPDDARRELEAAAEAADVSDAVAKAADRWIHQLAEFECWLAAVVDPPAGLTEARPVREVIGGASASEEAACRALRAYRTAPGGQTLAAEAAVLEAIAKCNSYYVERMERGVPTDD